MNETETQPRQTIQLDNIKYFADSLPEEAQMLLSHIQIVDDSIAETIKNKTISELAKAQLVGQLASLTDQFETAPDTEIVETEVEQSA